MAISREQLDTIVATGDFDALIGSSETAWLECKGQPYTLTNEAVKRELAKDVSSFANAGGGKILIGVKTKASATHFGDEIEEIRPFAQSLVNITQYQSVLDAWLYPGIEGLSISWVPTKTDNAKGVVVISIPQQKEGSKPYLIVKTFDGAKHSETLLGYAERKGDSSKPFSVAELQSALRSGLSFESRISERLDAMEALLKGAAQAGITAEDKKAAKASLEKRITEAVAHGGIAKRRHIVLSASPEPPGLLKSIFLSAADSIKQKLEDPPSLRYGGWDLTHHDQPKIVRGESLRVTNGDRKAVDLYRDGTMVFAAIADGEFLAWGRDGDERLNSLALIEVIYSFLNFYTLVLDDFATKPTKVSVRVDLQNMHLSSKKSTLNPYRIGSAAQMSTHHAKEAPDNKGCLEVVLPTQGFDPRAAAFEVVKKVYLWFGFEEDKIPYFKEENGVKVLDTMAISKI